MSTNNSAEFCNSESICCKISGSTVKFSQNWDVEIFSLIISIFMFFASILMLAKLTKNFIHLSNYYKQEIDSKNYGSINDNEEKNPLPNRVIILPVYYGYTLCACIWFILQSMTLLMTWGTYDEILIRTLFLARCLFFLFYYFILLLFFNFHFNNFYFIILL